MLFVQVLKLKVSLPLCWHCSDICPTTANNLPTLSSECFWSQTLPREGRSVSNSENKSFFDSRSGGSLVRWAGTSPTSSTGPTSQPATSSWWTTSTTSTPNGESPGKPSSICLDRFAAKYKSRNDNLLISGSIRWASDRWLRQAAVVHIHLSLVQPGTPHRRLQVLRRLRNPGLPQPGGVHGVHLFAPSPGLCTVTHVLNCSPWLHSFYAGYSWGVWSALQRRHHLPDQHGSWDPWPDLGGAAQGLCWRWQGREQGGDRQATSRGHAQVASLLFVLAFILSSFQKAAWRLLTTWGEGGHWGVGWDAADEHLPQVELLARPILKTHLCFVSRQEIDRMQRMLSLLRRTLTDLVMAIEGTIIMSDDLKEVLDNMFDAKVEKNPDILRFLITFDPLLGSWKMD